MSVQHDYDLVPDGDSTSFIITLRFTMTAEQVSDYCTDYRLGSGGSDEPVIKDLVQRVPRILCGEELPLITPPEITVEFTGR
jgi:hypothetical protein